MHATTRYAILLLLLIGTTTVLTGQSPNVDPAESTLILPTNPNAPVIPSASLIGPDDGDVDRYEGYVWYSPVLRRGDTNRQDFTIPLQLQNDVEVRGIGQIFNPFYLYDYYSEIYTSESDILPLDSGLTDADYIGRYREPVLYTVDSIFLYPYKYILSDPTHSAYIDVFRTDYDFNSEEYRTGGFVRERGGLSLVGELEMTPEMIDRTVGEWSQADSFRVFETKMRFDPPLELDRKESLAILFINDDAPALPFSSINNFSEAQLVLGYAEYGRGEPEYFSAPVDSFRCFGIVMERRNGVDTISSLWKKRIPLANGKTVPSNATTLLVAYGSAGFVSGLRHHFGGSVRGQGIASVYPLPATSHGTIEFSLERQCNVRLELYSLDGERVAELEDGKLPRGNFSRRVDLGDLPHGIYIVRLTADGEVYSAMLPVSRE